VVSRDWIAVEFDLLYRWHGLVPDGITVAGDLVKPGAFRSNNALLEHIGVGPLIQSASGSTPAR